MRQTTKSGNVKRRTLFAVLLVLTVMARTGDAGVSTSPISSDPASEPSFAPLQDNMAEKGSVVLKQRTGSVAAEMPGAVSQLSGGNYFKIKVEGKEAAQKLSEKIAACGGVKKMLGGKTADLAAGLDLLYLTVTELMGIRLKHFSMEIRVFRNAQDLQVETERLFGSAPRKRAFFVPALDSVFVDAENVDISALAHELAHAVQVHYFVVPPPEKAQEILAGYVEYQIRKQTELLRGRS